ncbi:MAG: prepilin-type N-terminal cleavage/methylation domain-containing protein [Phycisphaerae bacterium]|nr:prepilin-type N-terminal cleavage/methylation domain-containing protein [Phycisphaerae bacterium]
MGFQASRRSRAARRTIGAFTLIEVLVVVAVIALLISILIPSLKAAKDMALRSDCASNLHQVGVALNAYANEYREQLPPLYRTTTAFTTYYMRTAGPGTVNLGLLANRRYVTEPKLFYCSGQSPGDCASLVYNGPDNTWYSDAGWAALESKVPVRSSYPARLIEVPKANSQIGSSTQMEPMPAGVLTGWKIGRYSNKVIYSDFTGVNKFKGGGIVEGLVSSPHARKGFNRLFSDSAVRWAKPDLVDRLRPITSEAPTPEEHVAYYKLLDHLP